jgi:hypothetical protein
MQLFWMCGIGLALACIAAFVVMGSTGHGYIEGDIHQSRLSGSPPRFLFPFDLGTVEVTRSARSLVAGFQPILVRDTTQDAWWKWWPFWEGVYVETPVIDRLLDLHRRGQWDHPASMLTDGQRAWNHNVLAARAHTASDPDPARRAQQRAAPWIHRPIIGQFGRGDDVLWYVTIPDAGTTTVTTTPPPFIQERRLERELAAGNTPYN